jgi:hypothetical protein
VSEILTREVMGVLALGVLWLNTLLVAAAAIARARGLLRRRSELRLLDPRSVALGGPGRYGLVRTEAAQDGLAVLAVEQVGRHAAGKRRAILWHDRAHASTVRGGTVTVAGHATSVRVAAAGGADAEAWLPPGTVEATARCPDAAAFDAAHPSARKARGVTRTLEAEVPGGGGLFVAGLLHRDGDGLVIGPGEPGQPLVVSAVDPRAWLGARVALLLAFAPAVVAGAAVVTALALWPPVFDGAVSKIGGLACFVYFLLVLPAGTRARDAAIEPPHRLVRGRWDDPSGPSAPATAPSRAG